MFKNYVSKLGEISSEDTVIVVVSQSGVGKSFISAVTQADRVPLDHGLRSHSRNSQDVKCTYPYEMHGRKVVFWNIRAFRDEMKMRTEIEKLNSNYRKKPVVAGILYLHRISDTWMMRSPLKHLKPFESLFGSKYPQKIVLVTTMWRSVDEAEGLLREGELREDHWKSMLDLGSNMFRYDDTAESAWNAINLLLHTNTPSQSQELAVDAKLQLPRSQSEDLLEEALILGVMGSIGAGKTSFVNVTTEGNSSISDNLRPSNADIRIVKLQCLERCSLDIFFVDTPGLDTARTTDVRVLNMIANWLKKNYGHERKLDGVLYFHPISDNRMRGTLHKIPRLFEIVCGENALQNVFLVTTMWDKIDEGAGSQQEKLLKEIHWKEMIDQGSSTTLRHSNTSGSAWDTIDQFVQTANSRYAELLQREMADMKNLMVDHASFDWDRLEKLVEKQQGMMLKIRTQTKQQPEQGQLHDDDDEDLQIQLATIFTEMQALKIPLGKYLLRVFSPPWN